MIFNQYYLECLSQASYLIGDETTGRAVVVDPRRDISEYLQDAEELGMKIELVIETHFHADFLSGHLELADATGAEIVYGEAGDAEFPHRKVADGERYSLGEVTLEFRATPGHTPESISLVVYEHAGDDVPFGVLTGDALFIGDVGRPDLLASKGVRAEDLARDLYDSVHTKLLTLPDETRVYPAHGAGSACGKNLSTETVSTIGEQRRTNYALAPMTADEFIAAVTEGQNAAPGYFGHDAVLNREQRALFDTSSPEPVTLDAALERRADGAVLVDVRSPDEFAQGHIAGSINIGLEGRFAEHAGEIIGADTPIVIIAPSPEAADEAKTRLARIGYDTVVGALLEPEAVLTEHPEHARIAPRITAHDLHRIVEADDRERPEIIDVRSAGERKLGAIPDSRHVPLSTLMNELDEIDTTRPIVVQCAGGYRSSIAASVLRAHGADDVSDLIGGYTAWVQPLQTA